MSDTKTISINPSGKQQLMSDARKVSAHRNLMQQPQFQESLNMALLEYQLRLAINTTDANAAASSMFKLKGAMEFADVMIKLGETAPRIEPSKIAQLDHKA